MRKMLLILRCLKITNAMGFISGLRAIEIHYRHSYIVPNDKNSFAVFENDVILILYYSFLIPLFVAQSCENLIQLYNYYP